MSDDILSKLELDARRLRVARKLPDDPLDMQVIYQIIDDFHTFLRRHKLTLTQVARELGKGYSVTTLSCLKNSRKRRYSGDLERIARGLNQFMETYKQRQEVPMPDGFVETRVARRMLVLIMNVMRLGSMGVIYGPAGIGKTMVLQAAASKYAGSILIRVKRSTRVPGGLAKQLCKALKIDAVRSRRLYDQQVELERVLIGSNRLVLVDEAHQLTVEALELIRDIHDEAGVPIILCGTRLIGDKVSDTDQWLGQFNRRTALRYNATDYATNDNNDPKPLFSVDEIRKAFESDQLRLADDGAQFLTDLSNCLGLGGLGLSRQVCLVAVSLFGGKALDRRMLWKVFQEMHPRDVVGQVKRRMQNQAVAAKAG